MSRTPRARRFEVPSFARIGVRRALGFIVMLGGVPGRGAGGMAVGAQGKLQLAGDDLVHMAFNLDAVRSETSAGMPEHLSRRRAT
jgi:hypothetical protein